ncbi:MAG TPA: ArsI/CadI family heavy metal resistance metalloenzyme [Candidatus Binatus sp.]|uniref:ArsI/CadI family heavy metal resistance metalloenzyme n=1 Tax=Candidatus Binatus sp. TaxID=2811406 RepID=UPI002B46C54E|nr:ArsI/CadI family heavy metal resistance metalloenzyme [Candidatus Binatus sp.]HKN14732.1 ArsI/CadI family heavy metal resistance metalloenzyme [Candidatus Binatus sp.]
MKRMHIHVAVKEIPESIKFYSTMFGVEPSVVKPDYAKWMLEDPRVNFAVSTFGRATGLDHLGVQVETPDELREIAGRLKTARETVVEQRDAACCYARSDKAWATDPNGLSWETFFTMGETTVYGEELRPVTGAKKVAPASACCVTPAPAGACCGAKTGA